MFEINLKYKIIETSNSLKINLNYSSNFLTEKNLEYSTNGILLYQWFNRKYIKFNLKTIKGFMNIETFSSSFCFWADELPIHISQSPSRCARIQVITLLRAARALCPNLINILPDTPEGLYPPPPTGCFATCLRSAPKNPFSVLPPAPLYSLSLSHSLFINPAASARGLQSRLPLSPSLSL